jgi:hypothetical protein
LESSSSKKISKIRTKGRVTKLKSRGNKSG